MPRWPIALAFVAGLVPGLLLYWSAAQRPAPAPVASVAAPAVVAPAPAPASSVEKKATPREPGRVVIERREADPRLAREHQETLAKLGAAERSLAEVHGKLRELESRLAAETEQHQQAAQKQEREWREQLQAAQRATATAEATLKQRETRINELELTAQRAQRSSADNGQRQQRLNELASELEEVARRRESYLNAILGRYREATDLFRAISLRLDNPRDAGSPLNNDLSRIQAAIQHADEDLRQLRALNAQSARLQRELGARR